MTYFTVIIPCYNAADTLAETLESLFSQSFSDWDAVLVDDGSSDQTPALIKAACARDRRLNAILLENGGPSHARNAGARWAKGTCLAFLDADDLWMPGKLAEVAQVFEANHTAAAVYGQIGFFHNSHVTDFTTSTVRPGATSLRTCLGENPACTASNLSVRRDVFKRLGGFDTSLRYAEDMEFQLRLIGSGEVLFGLNSLQVRYRARDTGLSANLTKMHEGWRQAVTTAQKNCAPISGSVFRQAEAVHLRYLARRALRLQAAPLVAAGLAFRGIAKSPAAFLSDRRRGLSTLAGCLAAPLMWRSLRARLFA